MRYMALATVATGALGVCAVVFLVVMSKVDGVTEAYEVALYFTFGSSIITALVGIITPVVNAVVSSGNSGGKAKGIDDGD